MEVAYTDKWDVINLSHAPLVSEEAEEREEALAEVMDPLFMFRADADADGEGDADGEVHIEEPTTGGVNGNADPSSDWHMDTTIEVAS